MRHFQFASIELKCHWKFWFVVFIFGAVNARPLTISTVLLATHANSEPSWLGWSMKTKFVDCVVYINGNPNKRIKTFDYFMRIRLAIRKLVLRYFLFSFRIILFMVVSMLTQMAFLSCENRSMPGGKPFYKGGFSIRAIIENHISNAIEVLPKHQFRQMAFRFTMNNKYDYCWFDFVRRNFHAFNCCFVCFSKEKLRL